MKKIFATLLLTVLMALPSSAQVKFGLKGGLNVTDMSLSSEVFDASNRAGFFIGPTVKISLPLTGLGIDGSVLYDQRSAKIENNVGETQTVKQQQIAIPVNLRYGVGLGSLANVFLFAGPQVGFNVGDDEFSWRDTSSYSLKKSNFSVNVGLGATLLKHLQVTANYNIACGKTADVNLWKTVSDATGQVTGLKSKSRNNSWQIALAYFF
ncbi:MAG TPA: hypothetical protein DD401_00730 [Prevotella sp.]|nr:hypothetical protein [Prevotella sp.]